MSKASRAFHVPDALANLYDFANTLDLRNFVHHGVQHQQADELETATSLGKWMVKRGLAKPGVVPSRKTFEAARQLREKIRDYLKSDPADRRRKTALGVALNKAMEPFSLRVATFGKDGIKLVPAKPDVWPGLSAIVTEFYDGSANGTLGRLKMCAANECQRVFFDRSKPGTRRWCQSTLCGNREKTRSYRERRKAGGRGLPG